MTRSLDEYIPQWVVGGARTHTISNRAKHTRSNRIFRSHKTFMREHPRASRGVMYDTCWGRGVNRRCIRQPSAALGHAQVYDKCWGRGVTRLPDSLLKGRSPSPEGEGDAPGGWELQIVNRCEATNAPGGRVRRRAV